VKPRQRLDRLAPLLGLALFGAALWLLSRELHDFRLTDVRTYLRQLPPWRVAVALGLTALNYSVLTGYDALALHYVREKLPYRRTALVSFISYAMSMVLGHAVLTGGAIRYQLYSALGVSTENIAKIAVFCGVAFWVGFLALGGVVFLVDPLPVPVGFPVSPRVLGGLFVGVSAAWIILNAVRRQPLRRGRWTIELPGWRTTLAQMAVGSMDLVLAAGVLWMLLPAHPGISVGHLLSAYLLAVVVGVVSTVPAGLGVFDGLLVALLAPAVPAPVVVGAVVAYRAVYYVLPFGAAVLTLVASAAARRRAVVAGHLSTLWEAAGRWLPVLVPRALAATTFGAGAILLVTGALPSEGSRISWLSRAVPLGAIEASHFAGSVAGAALLVVAGGLWRRRDGAYAVAAGLLGLGVVASLVRGVDYEEATILLLTLAVLVPCRRYFSRRSALFGARASAGWLLAVAVVLLGTLWVGLFSYRHVSYATEMWWQFAFRADAPRFLRGMAGAAGVVLTAGIAHLLRSSPKVIGTSATPEALQRARVVIARCPETEANLALLGDKRLLFRPDVPPGDPADGFVMYASQGSSWIAMSAPIGPRSTRESLAWAFRAAAESEGARPVFYELPEQDLALMLELDFALYKLGEEATVSLTDFSLEGGARRGLRRTLRQVEATGCTMEVVAPDGVDGLLPELRSVSDAWLAQKNVPEKGFSLGRFDEAYLRNFPVGVVRRPVEGGDGTGPVVAFANLWASDRLPGVVPEPASRTELSCDLMRFDPASAPDGVMEYLFIRLMQWGASEGYEAFSLGMAPMSGLEPDEASQALAPLWNRAGALLYRYGEQFYNFRGLRAFKEKFDPVWTSRYLAVPRGRLALTAALTDVAALIAGGIGDILRR
jgi:phosphatidylglycerol lysyltransferase